MHIEGPSKTSEHNLKRDLQKEFTKFIQTYQDLNGVPKYLVAAKNAIFNNKRHLVFGFKDLMGYNSELAKLVFDEYYRY